MNIRKRFLALCLIFVLCSVSLAGAFYDVIPEDWFYSYINRAAGLGIMQGYENMAMPYDSLTKEQCIAMLQRSLSSDSDLFISDEYFSLLEQAGFSGWAYESGAYGFESGIIRSEDFTFSPASEPAKRILIARWTAKALNCFYMPMYILRYQDSQSVPAESMKYIDAMYRYGIMRGDNSNPYLSIIDPYSDISRAEFAKISTLIYEINTAPPEYCMENSVVNVSGNITSVDTANNTMVLRTEDGSAFIKIEYDTGIIINGAAGGLSDINTLTGRQVCLGTAAGSQVICVSTAVKRLTGELTDIRLYSDYTALYIDGAIYYMDGNSSGSPQVGTVTFIAEGAHIIEIK